MAEHVDAARKQGDVSRASTSQTEQFPDITSALGSFYAMQRAIKKPGKETLTPQALVQLQRTIGNQATLQLVDTPIEKLQRLPETVGSVHVTGTETLGGELYVEGENDSEERRNPVSSNLRGIHASDANQGMLGDCFAIASMAAVAYQNPALIYRAIQDNGDGTFAVTLYRREYPSPFGNTQLSDLLGFSYVLIPEVYQVTPEVLTGYVEGESQEFADGSIATELTTVEPHVQQDDTTTTNEGGQPQRRNELWAVVLERALGMLLSDSTDTGEIYSALSNEEYHGGGYGQPRGQEVMLEALTGQRSSEGEIGDISLVHLGQYFNMGYAITMATVDDTEESAPLIANHAYYLTGVNVAEGTISLRNPHSWDTGVTTIRYADAESKMESIEMNPARSR